LQNRIGKLKDEKINEVITTIIEILQKPPEPPPPISKALERGKSPKSSKAGTQAKFHLCGSFIVELGKAFLCKLNVKQSRRIYKET
jgi:hypothetical protein